MVDGRTLVAGAQGGLQGMQLGLQSQAQDFAQKQAQAQQALSQQQMGLQQQQLQAKSAEKAAAADAYLQVDPKLKPFAEQIRQNPALAEKIRAQMQIDSEQKKLEAAQFAAQVKNLPPEMQDKLIAQRIQRGEASGRNMSDTKSLLKMTPAERKTALDGYLIASMDEKQLNDYLKGNETADMKLAREAGIDLRTEAGRKAFAQLKGGTTVNVGAGQTEEQKAIGKYRGQQYAKVADQADVAENNLQTIQQLRAINPETGKFAGVKAELASIAQGFGMTKLAQKFGDAKSFQAANALSTKMLSEMLATQKGPQTEPDAQRLKATIAHLGDTQEAFKYKLNAMSAVAERQIEKRNFLDEKIGQGMDVGQALKQWNAYIAKTPLVASKLKDPKTGLPLMFTQFKAVGKENGASDQEILEKWRQMNGVKQ